MLGAAFQTSTQYLPLQLVVLLALAAADAAHRPSYGHHHGYGHRAHGYGHRAYGYGHSYGYGHHSYNRHHHGYGHRRHYRSADSEPVLVRRSSEI